MNILQLDMNLLKVLYVMLITGSTSKTAQKLGLSASAVSHALSRLRESLDDPLFRREGNQQVPTLFAVAVKNKLVPLFESLNEELFKPSSCEARHFRIVLPPALNVLLTPELALQGHQAKAVIECLTFERRAWRDELNEGKIDLLIAIGDHQTQQSSLYYEKVGKTQLIVAYGPPLQQRLSDRENIHFHELAEYDHFYCHPWPQTVNELDRQQMRSGFTRHLAFVCSDYSQLMPALRNAPMMAVIPRPWYETFYDRQQIKTLPLLGHQAEGSLFLQYRVSTTEWKRKIIDALKNVLKNYYLP
ncbi:LysR family transcriptional regulator [Pseudescherichia sp.]|uniref:LysR family transcriptional regulator n=1 Tax=Pseudescherichia sp. TaxID=2055881 RepID=UPI0028A5FE93|nr:LysR family transcriptional regulator [Pseudescherichia sp.]